MAWLVLDKTSSVVSRASDVLDVIGLLSIKNSVNPRELIDGLRVFKSFENAQWAVSKEENANENLSDRRPTLSVVRV